MFKHIHKETNRYAKQQMNKKKQEGSLSPKSVFALWNTVSLQEIKKLFAIIIHMSMLYKSSLWDYWSLRPIIHTPYAASVGMSRDRFLTILTMFHLNNDEKAARGQPGYDPLFKIRPVIDTHQQISGCLHTGRTADHQRGKMPISRAYIFSCIYQRKAPQIRNKNI